MTETAPVIVSGCWKLKLDEQGRIVLPASVRRSLEDAGEPNELVITKNFNRSLSIYWRSLWAHTVMRATRELDGQERYAWFSYIGPSAVTARIDKAGKFTVPKELLAYADIQDELLIAGKIFFLEAWEPKRFQIEQENLAKNFNQEEMAGKLMQSLPYADGFDGRGSSPPSRHPNSD